ncbi:MULTISPECIES: DUF4870 domain-containing protein [Actinomadura]|uniref:DUF4870 domain-containing protein n=1 Tax=Actinomadura litoris TaxID=2678616 RepID=A0A7K1LCH8_9ACTN|nr:MULTISPECIES: DUF4870 domain-containing protein [Actinomadura]MBT2213763.1 DUF4870 domain-containing protein [Actinomadura sp. NEAU-AAG7]MUN41905.1 DUF4870 domain-containing protein [Actinomadura litoris]
MSEQPPPQPGADAPPPPPGSAGPGADTPPPPPGADGPQPPPYQGAYGYQGHQGGYQGPPPPGGPYPPPPGGPYDPRWGYGPPGVPYGPPPQMQSNDPTWAIFSYLGTLLVGFLAPLIIYFVKMRDSAFVRFHAAQALNYQITLLIHILAVAVVCVPPAIIAKNPAFLIPLILPYLEALIAQWVFLILGAVKAGKHEYYRFPTFFCFRMIR